MEVNPFQQPDDKQKRPAVPYPAEEDMISKILICHERGRLSLTATEDRIFLKRCEGVRDNPPPSLSESFREQVKSVFRQYGVNEMFYQILVEDEDEEEPTPEPSFRAFAEAPPPPPRRRSTAAVVTQREGLTRIVDNPDEDESNWHPVRCSINLEPDDQYNRAYDHWDDSRVYWKINGQWRRVGTLTIYNMTDHRFACTDWEIGRFDVDAYNGDPRRAAYMYVVYAPHIRGGMNRVVVEVRPRT